MSAGYKWKRLQRATVLKPPSEALISEWLEQFPGETRESILARINAELAKVEYWRNDLYQVEVRRTVETKTVHLNIRRIDGYPGRDWRHFQQIKNELIGENCEAVELYPAEDRKVDATNKYHLFGCADPAFRFPFGFEQREVAYKSHDEGGLRQRPEMKVRK